MRKEYFIMLLIFVGSLLSILIFIKKKDIRRAFLATMTAQLFTWPIGIILVSLGKIDYPVRLFPKAVDSSFLHGYLMNPISFAIFYVNYPSKAKLIYRWLFTLLISYIPVVITDLVEKYTELVAYRAWRSYYTWIMTLLIYFFARKYLDWFFKNVPKLGVIDDET